MSHANCEATHLFISIVMFNAWRGAPGIHR